MQRPSTLRRMVEDKLGTPVTDWIAKARSEGLTIEEAWIDLRNITGVPVALRTIYVWLERDTEEEAAS